MKTTNTASLSPKASTVAGLDDTAIRAVTLLSSALLFAAPAFATQANPQNIIALSDMMFKYAKGEITVSQPSAQAAQDASHGNTTVFS